MAGASAERLNEISCDVTVVPILAPMITPAAWYRSINPEFTKLTTITVQALDDWITAVKRVPTRIPRNGVFVKNSRIALILAPAACSKLSLINLIPYKKSPSPPISPRIISAIAQLSPLYFTLFLLFLYSSYIINYI